MTWSKFSGVVMLVIAAVFLHGCRRGGSLEERGGKSARVEDLTELPGTAFHATFTSNTVKIDRDTIVKNLRGISAERSLLVFDNSFEPARKLVPGNLLLIPNTAVMKVVKVKTVQSYIAVQTTTAALTDLIQDGEVRWNYPVKFQSLLAKNQGEDPRALPATSSFGSLRTWLLGSDNVVYAASESGCGFSGKLSGWNYTMRCSSEADRLNLNFDLKKSLGADNTPNASVEISGVGYIQNFDTSLDMSVRNNLIQSLAFGNKNLNGVLNFTWSASTEATGPITTESRIRFPPALKIPLPIGGIPFILKITGALLFKPGFTGKNEVAMGKFRVEYNGVQGVSIKEGNVDKDGEAHGKFAILGAPSFSGVGPMGFITGLAFPRIELALAGMDTFKELLPEGLSAALDKLASVVDQIGVAVGVDVPESAKISLKSDAAAYTEVVTVTSLVNAGLMTSLGVPCQDVQLIVEGKVGVQIDLLGHSLVPAASSEVKLFHHGETMKTGTCGGQGATMH